jgi:hypothetical protein
MSLMEISLLFPFTQICFEKGKGRQKMVKAKAKSKTEKEKSLAEKCRIALEKNYGTPVPMPKDFGKNTEFYD